MGGLESRPNPNRILNKQGMCWNIAWNLPNVLSMGGGGPDSNPLTRKIGGTDRGDWAPIPIHFNSDFFK